MPEEIRNRLKKDPRYLEVLRSYQDQDFGSSSTRRYWCFPRYKSGSYSQNNSKVINESSILSNNTTVNASRIEDIERSVSPTKGVGQS